MVTFFDIIGWIGTALILLAYFINSFRKTKSDTFYQLMNLVGAIFMGVGLFPKNAWFSFALQVAWGIIAIASLVKIIISGRAKRKNTRNKNRRVIRKR